ncbi:MAG: sodium-translocating pyrophosphatase [Methanopyri archaeon]|nr:sodium-translocating pyrophosphatase [Methanopyri archaeon]
MDPMTLYWFAPLGALIALVFAYLFYQEVNSYDEGNDTMREIASHVREGAMAYLEQQYREVAKFFAGSFVLLMVLSFGMGMQSKWVPFAFVTGGAFSALAGYIGMKTATNASARTAEGARHSLNRGLTVAFRAGSVMGLTVVGLGLLYIAFWFYILKETNLSVSIFGESLTLQSITTTMLAFGMGASFQALFARVGGGIFTKAADVGADLVGKVEAGIPEDDPRNPATIADNVGDNVGDVAGMGADLFESYLGSILAAATLGVAAGLGLAGVILPMVIAAAGIISSVLGIYLVKTKEDATQMDLLHSLDKGINASSVLIVIGAVILVKLLLVDPVTAGVDLDTDRAAPAVFGRFGPWGILGSIITGLVAGIIIGKATEYYTNASFAPTQLIAEQSKTGPATLIIAGIATGMLSTIIPVLTVGLGTLLAFGLAGGFVNPAMGLFGVGIAAVGMLSTLGITLATDAYGPIADNAGGNAEMSGLGEEVRERTDALDSLGNTTAATGKGFAIGSAALTALALLAAYIEQVRVGLVRAGLTALPNGVPLATAKLADFMAVYNVTLMNPAVLVGLFIGSMLSFVFCAMTMMAVGRAASLMVDEVRRQFREIPGIMEGTGKPDYASCVRISTEAAQQEMIVPSLMALIAPIAVGLILGIPGVMGLLAGTLATGFTLAVFMANAGGAWDNAKKYIETQERTYDPKDKKKEHPLTGKGSDMHKAAVVGDTVGDPFKDTSGPSLNILIKLMSMVSVVVAGLVVKYNIFSYLQ